MCAHHSDHARNLFTCLHQVPVPVQVVQLVTPKKTQLVFEIRQACIATKNNISSRPSGVGLQRACASYWLTGSSPWCGQQFSLNSETVPYRTRRHSHHHHHHPKLRRLFVFNTPRSVCEMSSTIWTTSSAHPVKRLVMEVITSCNPLRIVSRAID